MGSRNQYGSHPKEPCLTMHQPWASLLGYGIKRIEGRSWPAPIRGRLWIHAASKVPDAATISAMEEFYRRIYALEGITDLIFPEHYPVSRLLGCVEVVGCLRREELARWKAVPEGVGLEGLTNFCWLCERPQKLSDPLKMRGDQGIYNLEMKIAQAAVRCLLPAESPSSIKFPLPKPHDRYSLRPGSLPIDMSEKLKEHETEKSPRLAAAIAGAQAAATQFSKKGQETPKDVILDRKVIHDEMTHKLESISLEKDKRISNAETKAVEKGKSKFVYVRKQREPGSDSSHGLDHQQHAGPSLIFTAAPKNIRPVRYSNR